METKRKFGAALAVLVLSFALAGCSDGAGLDDEGGIGDEDMANSGESRFDDDGPRGREEREIGGFSVDGPEGQEISVPEAEAEPDEVASYTGSVRSVLEDGPQGLSSLVDPEVGLEGSTVNLGLGTESVEDALEANEEALEELQQLDTPGGLGDIQDGLVDSRERAVAAYDDINQASINDASADEIADVVEESLPEIEYSEAETRAILQELQRASGN